MSWAGGKDKPGLEWMLGKRPRVSSVLFLPQLQEKEGRDAPCPWQVRNKRKGRRKCNAFVRSRCSHNGTQLQHNGSDSMFAFIPIWAWCPPRSSCHCSTHSAGPSPLAHTPVRPGASWPHRAHSYHHHCVGTSFGVEAMWWGWLRTSSGLLPNSLTTGTLLPAHKLNLFLFSKLQFLFPRKVNKSEENKAGHGEALGAGGWSWPVMLC